MPGPRGWGSTAAGCRVPGHLPRHLAVSGRSRPSASQDAPHPGRSWSEAPGPGRAGPGSSAGPPRCCRGSPGPVAGSAPGPSPSAPSSRVRVQLCWRVSRRSRASWSRATRAVARSSQAVNWSCLTRNTWSRVWRASRDGCSLQQGLGRAPGSLPGLCWRRPAPRGSGRSHGWGGCARHRYRAGAPPRWHWGLCARWGWPPEAAVPRVQRQAPAGWTALPWSVPPRGQGPQIQRGTPPAGQGRHEIPRAALGAWLARALPAAGCERRPAGRHKAQSSKGSAPYLSRSRCALWERRPRPPCQVAEAPLPRAAELRR